MQGINKHSLIIGVFLYCWWHCTGISPWEGYFLCVNMPGLREAQRAGRTVFLAVSVKESMEEININIQSVVWGKRICPHPLWVAHTHSIQDLERAGGRERGTWFLCLNWAVYLFLPTDVSTFASHFFRFILRNHRLPWQPGLWAWSIQQAFLVLQLAESRQELLFFISTWAKI